jgi:hypothetical protein
MKLSRVRRLDVSRAPRALAFAGVALALSLSAGTEGHAWGAPGSPSASASAAPAPAGPPPTPVKGADIPADPSPAPTAADWDGARAVSVSHGVVPPCRLSLVREWLRIVCDGSPGAGLVAGDPKSVRVWSLEAETDDKLKSGVDLELRRGRSFIVSFLGTAPGYSASSTAEGPLVQIGWREGTADPIITAYLPK